MLGTVTKIDQHRLTIALDDKDEHDQSNEMTISIKDYQDIEHGYSTTIHKSQGATVDKSYVLASQTMDRHLTYVAMTRHKQETKLYTNNEEFSSHETMVNTLSRTQHKQMAIEQEGKSAKSRKGSLLRKEKKASKHLSKIEKEENN